MLCSVRTCVTRHSDLYILFKPGAASAVGSELRLAKPGCLWPVVLNGTYTNTACALNPCAHGLCSPRREVGSVLLNPQAWPGAVCCNLGSGRELDYCGAPAAVEGKLSSLPPPASTWYRMCPFKLAKDLSFFLVMQLVNKAHPLQFDWLS